MVSDFERTLGDIIKKVELGEIILTKFLDLEELAIAKSLQNKYNISFFGGSSFSERQRAIINGSNPKQKDFNIIVYKINYPKTLNISHRNILGTLMSLGIKRNTFGDIIVRDEECYLMCSTEISSFIEQEFTKINHQPIELKKVSYQQLEYLEEGSKLITTVIVPSLRLDVIVANGFNISRNKVVDKIETKEVFINNKVITKPDYEVKLNDLISCRGFGRLKLIDIGKVTKKNRIVLSLEVYK